MQISSNIPALQTYTSMLKSSKAVANANLRLSTGKKINSAKDDPAGLAIANKLRLQMRSINRASQNSMDGISLVQTAEGSLNEITNIIQRTRELTVQAANDSNTTDDRIKMQNEINTLLEEVNGMSDRSEFNRIGLLNGESGKNMNSYLNGVNQLDVEWVSPVTPNGSYTMTVDTVAQSYTYSGVLSGVFPGTSGSYSLNGIDIPISANDDAAAVFGKIGAVAKEAGYTVTGDATNFTITSDQAGSKYAVDLVGNAALAGTATLTETVTGIDAVVTPTATVDGFTATTANYTADGNNITVYDQNGIEISVEIKSTVVNGQSVTLNINSGPLILQIGPSKGMDLEINIPKITTKTLGVDNVCVLSNEYCGETLNAFDTALRRVTDIRSSLGAFQNRLEHTVENLNSSEVNTTESMSRIEDTDMASEMTEYTKNNVLNQAAISMLAQANQRPQQLLQLLGR